jgi:hypothetical protein
MSPNKVAGIGADRNSKTNMANDEGLLLLRYILEEKRTAERSFKKHI